MEGWITIGLLLLLQYLILILLLLKKPKWVNGDGEFGIIPWIPIIGPLSILFAFGFIAAFASIFFIPLGIANGFIYILNKFIDEKIKYIG